MLLLAAVASKRAGALGDAVAAGSVAVGRECSSCLVGWGAVGRADPVGPHRALAFNLSSRKSHRAFGLQSRYRLNSFCYNALIGNYY